MLPTKETSKRIAKDMTDVVGHTPMVYLHKITEGLEAKIAVKLEYINPSMSVKDRPAVHMLEDAEKSGALKPGDVVLEATSGNMGIGLAMACAIKGYKLVLVIPDSMSLERRILCKAHGATVILVDHKAGFEGKIKKAEELQKFIPNCFFLNQYVRESNIDCHYKSTGPEIWDQTNGQVDVLVLGVGTGGTLSGAGKFLKEKNSNIKLYAVEPYESSVINGFEAGKHLIQGIGSGTITPNIKPIYEEALRVKSEDAINMAKTLATKEGILCGISSGANVCAALQLAKRPENKQKLIVTCLPSYGERYLSTDLYQNIKEECEKLRATELEEDKKLLTEVLGL
ncbi:unnamed protein product [Bursaphelenchus xylophilus]|uniref:Cysteine synthase n=1 Tax=Bursaphelenchus xylophilus TaxID=6326 RepID=A0A1I7S5Y9_BURXY|nr:unnamed protein product [Bursaphelenchus xylophilus]CAG9082495.1 unnamed protein product [Bursaphelenchus xylophilus]